MRHYTQWRPHEDKPARCRWHRANRVQRPYGQRSKRDRRDGSPHHRLCGGLSKLAKHLGAYLYRLGHVCPSIHAPGRGCGKGPKHRALGPGQKSGSLRVPSGGSSRRASAPALSFTCLVEVLLYSSALVSSCSTTPDIVHLDQGQLKSQPGGGRQLPNGKLFIFNFQSTSFSRLFGHIVLEDQGKNLGIAKLIMDSYLAPAAFLESQHHDQGAILLTAMQKTISTKNISLLSRMLVYPTLRQLIDLPIPGSRPDVHTTLIQQAWHQEESRSPIFRDLTGLNSILSTLVRKGGASLGLRG